MTGMRPPNDPEMTRARATAVSVRALDTQKYDSALAVRHVKRTTRRPYLRTMG